MVQKCCVKLCHNRSDREPDRRFYSIPNVINKKGESMKELTTRRRREWIAQLQLKTVTFESKGRKHVCSDHFVNGVKAYVGDVNSPSWKPTLKLGHSLCKGFSAARYNRLCSRRTKKAAEQASRGEEISEPNDMNDETDSAAAGTPPPEQGEDGGSYCQTEVVALSTLTQQEENLLREELSKVIKENCDLKEQLSKKEMNQESLRDQDDTVRYFTGLTDFALLSTLFTFVCSHLPSNKRRALSSFQSFMLTMIHLRLNTPLPHLAYMFCVSRTTAYKVFNETLNILYYRMKPMVFWPERQCIRASLPEQFLVYPWKRVVSIIDCFEIFIERPSCSDTSAMTWSHYKHNNTIKYLISITPQGHISFISKGWGGRTTDKKITDCSGYLNNLLPNDLVLADRGFDIHELVAMQGAEVKIPAFTKGKSQLTSAEIESTRKLAHLRIHVERIIGLLRNKFTILNTTIPIDLLFHREGEEVTTLDKIVTVGCAVVNLCNGII